MLRRNQKRMLRAFQKDHEDERETVRVLTDRFVDMCNTVNNLQKDYIYLCEKSKLLSRENSLLKEMYHRLNKDCIAGRREDAIRMDNYIQGKFHDQYNFITTELKGMHKFF